MGYERQLVGIHFRPDFKWRHTHIHYIVQLITTYKTITSQLTAMYVSWIGVPSGAVHEAAP